MFLSKRKLLLGGMLITSLSVSAQKTPQKYLEKFSPVAVSLSQETGVPASIILGIAMLESGSGTSKNARLLRNHFGIVGKNNLAKRGFTYRSMYREYTTDTASYRHFTKVVMKKKWFATMKGSDDYEQWLNKLIRSGYSTAGQVWVSRVRSMIKKYKLYELDDAMKLAKY